MRTLAALAAAGGLFFLPPARTAAQGTWAQTSLTVVPAARASHVGVWTGSKMIVWGGTGAGFANSGGVYDPATSAWTAIRACQDITD